MKFSAEMTWVPAKPPYELTDRKTAKLFVKTINDKLRETEKHGIFVCAKLDPFHNPYEEDSTFCIEIVPFAGFYWESNWFEPTNLDRVLFKTGIKKLFRICRELGLTPLPIVRKGRKEIHYPSGGCHIHLSNEFFPSGPSFYREMENFHMNLAADYADKPFIRWLFSQWFDNKNSSVIFNEAQLKICCGNGSPSRDSAFKTSFCGRYAIEPRFMVTPKNVYNTFEFRFVNMVANYDEFSAVVRALDKWTDSICRRSIAGEEIRPTITRYKYIGFNDLRNAKKLCKNWIDEIGLKWDDAFESLWVRNYRNRIKFGELL